MSLCTSEAAADLIRARRTVHDFKPDPIPPKALVEQALELARWAPNHHLTEPWNFYLLGPETKGAVCDLNYRLMVEKRGVEQADIKHRRWLAIPGWIAVACRNDDNPLTQQENYAACACAIQNAMLYWWSAGVGSKWSTGVVIRQPEFYEQLAIDPDCETVIGLLWYGYPARLQDPPRQRTLDSILIERP
ncbi:MAG: nitroreductase [Candidatus Competibacterales bacterium]